MTEEHCQITRQPTCNVTSTTTMLVLTIHHKSIK